jgi:hypothetical protein
VNADQDGQAERLELMVEIAQQRNRPIPAR